MLKFKRLIRTLIFILGAFFGIALALNPNTNEVAFSEVFLFAWIGAFTLLRPGSTTAWSIVIISIAYAIYTDEGIALGSIALIIFFTLIRGLRHILIELPFFVSDLAIAAIYLGVMFLKNIILAISFYHGLPVTILLISTFYFLIIHLVLNFIIRTTLRQRLSDKNLASYDSF